jgi:hypothetical protein
MILASIDYHNNLSIAFELFNFVNLLKKFIHFFPIGYIGP